MKAVCSPGVNDEIDSSVSRSIELWNRAHKSLRDLCDRYTRALTVWAEYREISDLVNEWADDRLHTLSTLPVEEARSQVQVRVSSSGSCVLELL